MLIIRFVSEEVALRARPAAQGATGDFHQKRVRKKRECNSTYRIHICDLGPKTLCLGYI